jgi:hypothetical protein
MAFKFLHEYDYMTQLCRQQAETIHNHEYATSDKGKSDTENIRGLNLAVVKHTTIQVTRLPLYRELLKIGHDLLFSAWID